MSATAAAGGLRFRRPSAVPGFGPAFGIAATGITLLVLALAVPVLWPWYLLWPVTTLAISTNDNRFRITATVICASVSLLVPPTGAGYPLRAYQIPLAVSAALVAFLLLLWLLRGKVPWPGPTRGRARGGAS